MVDHDPGYHQDPELPEFTSRGIPVELIHELDQQPDLRNRLLAFLRPWTVVIVPPGLKLFNEQFYPPGEPGFSPTPHRVGIDDSETIAGMVSTLTDNSMSVINMLARDYLVGKGRGIAADEPLSAADFLHAVERLGKQSTHRIDARLRATSELTTDEIEDAHHTLPYTMLIAGMQATMEMPTAAQTDEAFNELEYFDLINRKVRNSARAIIAGERIRDPESKAYEAAMTALQHYYDGPNTQAFIDEVMGTLMIMYLRDMAGRHAPHKAPLEVAARNIVQECALMGIALPVEITPRKLDQWYRRTETYGKLLDRPGGNQEYAARVISVYQKLMQASLARLLVAGLATDRIVPSDILEVQTYISKARRRHRLGITTQAPGEGEAEPLIVVDQYLDHEVLAPATGTRPDQEAGERQRPEIVLDHRIPELDRERVRRLVEEVIVPWPWEGAKLVARELKRRTTPETPIPVVIGSTASGEGGVELIQDKYYIAVLPRPVELPGGGTVMGKSAAAEHPRISGQRHAIFVIDARRGFTPDGEFVEGYWDVALRDKGTAYSLGAERVLHVGDPYDRVRNMLLGPLRPLRRGRVMGALATETTMDGTDDQV